MALEFGSRLGHYEVTALIGEGGMGQVYRATDTKLNATVLLGVSVSVQISFDRPETFARDYPRAEDDWRY